MANTCRRIGVVGSCMWLAACGPAAIDSASGNASGNASENASENASGSGGGRGDASTAGEAATLADDATGDGGVLTHGVVMIELRRSQSQATNPSVPTARIRVTVEYRECLSSFYEANPSWRQTGTDGELVFGRAAQGGEGWIDRLCAPGATDSAVSCEVESIAQTLDPIPQLTVTYAVTGEVENRGLLVGPLPTIETAGCPDPIVRLAANAGVFGEDAEGNEVWTAQSVSPTEAITDQDGAIVVHMAPSGG